MLLQLSVLLLLQVSCASASAFRGGWVDPDTLAKHYTITSYQTPQTLHLVMSDEFDTEGRAFHDGADPMWTALDKSDDDQTSGGKKSLQYYDPSTGVCISLSLK